MEEKKELNRGLKNRHLQLIALGGIIGSGYFLGTGYVISEVGPAAFLSYLLGGLIVYSVMYALGELAVEIPISSSFITYANRFISPSVACGVGWSYWITWVTFVPSEMIAAGIIMNYFIPGIDSIYWAVFFGAVVTVVNLINVKSFGELEFWLSIIKILAIVLFCVIGIFIFFGFNPTKEFLGTKVLTSSGGIFPKGVSVVFFSMVIILVNFQGSEIIGLAAGESENPEKNIPIAIRNVAFRIISLYVIPVFILVLIIPWTSLGLDASVFAIALEKNGFSWASKIFSFVVLTASISCSSSGLYGCSRAMYALSKEKMAPSFFSKLNKNQVPHYATLISILACWIGILAYFVLGEEIYKNLLALSGLSGAVAWISIGWSQYNFRKKIDESKLKFKTPFFPYFTLFGIWAQIICLGLMLFHEELRIAFYIGVPILILPILIHKFFLNKK
jgi:amino acid transporter, AAT family